MKIIVFILVFCTTFFAFSSEEPFSVDAHLTSTNAHSAYITLEWHIQTGHLLYADMIAVRVPGDPLTVAKDVPQPKTKFDELSQVERDVYEKPFTATYRIDNVKSYPIELQVEYQGCSDTLCFMPQNKTFSLSLDQLPKKSTRRSPTVSSSASASEVTSFRTAIEGFTLERSAAGYKNTDDFIAFLDGDDENAESDAHFSLWRLFLIFFGGFLLNLTPCVLPMIPINLAIIGAGSQAGSKSRGFALGGVYGLGIALSYGVLGLVVVLTGGTFGTINSMPWFNFGIAALFIVLALGMFDVIMIDFTRFQQKAAANQANKGTFAAAFIIGCVAALLAGACVAPIVIFTIVLAAKIYATGNILGLALPFLLGLGMAIPWPFAGAGMSFLPKPGTWMTRVKQFFGVLILLFAAYYAYIGYTLVKPTGNVPETTATEKHGAPLWLDSLDTAFAKARAENKQVVIDFWATWCKNCTTMDKTTFKDSNVVVRLRDFVPVKYHAEKPAEEPAKSVLEQFGVRGLPTYIILSPPTNVPPQVLTQ